MGAFLFAGRGSSGLRTLFDSSSGEAAIEGAQRPSLSERCERESLTTRSAHPCLPLSSCPCPNKQPISHEIDDEIPILEKLRPNDCGWLIFKVQDLKDRELGNEE